MLKLAIRANVYLDGAVFRYARAQRTAMLPSMAIVLIAAAAFGLGVWNVEPPASQPGIDANRSSQLIVAICSIFTGWFLWSAFIWLLAGKLFGGGAGFRATTRAIGLCYIPVALWLLLSVPIVDTIGFFVGLGWPLVSASAATKYVYQVPWWQAVIATAFGWLWGLVLVPLYFVFLPLSVGF